jgi:hypothetical protein
VEMSEDPSETSRATQWLGIPFVCHD